MGGTRDFQPVCAPEIQIGGQYGGHMCVCVVWMSVVQSEKEILSLFPPPSLARIQLAV